MLSVEEITLKNELHCDHRICECVILGQNQHYIFIFNNFHAQLSGKDLQTQVWQLSSLNASKHSAVTLLYSNCWRQTGKCPELVWNSEKLLTDKKRLPSFDSWMANLDMGITFNPFYLQFCQIHDNSSSVIIPAEHQFLTSQQGMLGDFIVFFWSFILITITMMEGNRSIPQLQSSHPTHRGFYKMENVFYKTN